MSRVEHPLSQEELMAYADGQMEAQQAVAAAQHLERCSDCSAVFNEVKRLSTQMGAWQVEECPDAVAKRVQAKVASYADVRKSSEPKQHWLAIRRGLVYGLGGAFVVLLLIYMIVPPLRSWRQAAQFQPFFEERSPAVDSPVGLAVRSGPQDQQGPQGQQGQQGQAPSAQIPSGPMVIRTMNLTMITKEFDPARTRIEAIIRQSQGYIDRLTIHADTGAARSLSATLRLPANQADSVLNELKTLGRLMQETQNSSDVTSQYVDLSARLSNARNSEMRLLSLLRNRAGDLKDVVAMEREISSVRESIERMEAQQKDLNNKIQFVTIQLELREEYHAELQPSVPSTGTQLRNAAVEGIRSGAENIVGIAFFLLRYGPLFAVWGTVVGGMIFLLIKRSRTDRRWIRR
jgi:hypothetical protein